MVVNKKEVSSGKSPNVTPPITKSKSQPVLSGGGGGGISLANIKHTNKQIIEDVFVKIPPSKYETEEGILEFNEMDDNVKMIIVGGILSLLQTPSSSESILSNAISDLIAITKEVGITTSIGNRILNTMKDLVESSNARESGLLLLLEFLKKMGKCIEPYAIQLFDTLLLSHADKSSNVRDLSSSIGKDILLMMNPYSFKSIFPILINSMKAEQDWRIKVGALEFIRIVASRVSQQISPCLPTLIPIASECMLDPKRQVQTAAIDSLIEACSYITNDDIRHLVPQLVSVIANPEESTKTLDLLLETTFVANVDSPTLALIAPLLGKALRGRSSVLKRKAARVIDSMCRLVVNPVDVAPFVPFLLPALDKVIDEIVDAEVCDVAKASREVLLKAMGEGGVAAVESKKGVAKIFLKIKSEIQNNNNGLDYNQVKANILSSLIEAAPTQSDNIICQYIAHLCSELVCSNKIINPNYNDIENKDEEWRYSLAMTSLSEWRDCTNPYIKAFIDIELKTMKACGESEVDGKGVVTKEGHTEKLSQLFRRCALKTVADAAAAAEAEDGNLCDFEFSLAFGGKILLHNARLRLGRGRRYAIMGKNGAGKTTLLTNIGNGHIEGLPSELKTMYVQHDEKTDETGMSLIDELLAEKALQDVKVTRDQATKALTDINFTPEMLAGQRAALSGGWKMKLLIIKAMLSNADILLLDEPTNHLDKASVQWLISYLQSQQTITCLIVSHDPQFLDQVVSDVIHYEGKKLVYYHGNLTKFVEIHPEAKYYYELEGSTLSFKFPVPERLEGINSTTRAVMKMDNISYTYPGATKSTLTNVSVKLCLGSRVAILGANGAGKSTLIKLLVQETQPDEGSGEVWKHHNLRVAYVAQHSFHHVEQHLDSSPVDYIKWRFAGGADKEDLAKPTMALTEEEVVASKEEKKYGDVVEVLGRRKNGRTMEYECTFFGQTKRDPNKYIPLEEMVEKGYQKLVQQCDTRIAAAAAGLDLRPLIISEIQGHLDDFNLEAEFGTHGSIRRMSGGQKVKLVLAAAMWNRPHIIILDEPTNYLDREALGALTQAIKGFHGGVAIISHNSEFTDALCTETWLVEGGTCHTTGEVEDTKLKVKSEKSIKKSRSASSLESAVKDDAGGNVNKTVKYEEILNPKKLEPLSKKEIRKLERCAEVAGMSLKDYVLTLTCKSPEWKWL